MIIFGIDPGTVESGYVLFNSDNMQVVESGVVGNEELLQMSSWDNSDIVCIEMVASYGMAVGQTTFDTILWIGRFVQIAVSKNKEYKLLYKKKDINPTICFSNKAKDANIRQAVFDMFPSTGGGSVPQKGTKSQPGPLYGVSSHAISALAVALTYCIQNKLINR
jgi:hypothetical protein